MAEWKWKCQKAEVDPGDDGRFSTSFSGIEQQDMHSLQQLHSGISRALLFVDSTWSVALVHLNVFCLNHQTAKTSAICTFKAGDVFSNQMNDKLKLKKYL